MENDSNESTLTCPKCGATGESSFNILAEVWVRVRGTDFLDVIDEGYEREYGSESACRCVKCGHQERLGAFYTDEQS